MQAFKCYCNSACKLTDVPVNLVLARWHLEVVGASWRLSTVTQPREVFPLRLIVPAVSLACATLYRAAYPCRQDWAGVQADSRLWRLSAATPLDSMQMYVNEEVRAWHLHTGGMDRALPCRGLGMVGTSANTQSQSPTRKNTSYWQWIAVMCKALPDKLWKHASECSLYYFNAVSVINNFYFF